MNFFLSCVIFGTLFSCQTAVGGTEENQHVLGRSLTPKSLFNRLSTTANTGVRLILKQLLLLPCQEDTIL